MAWEMDEKERNMVELVSSMCIDTMMNRGPNNKETYVENLRNMADAIELIGNEELMNRERIKRIMENSPKDHKNICIVRLITTLWKDNRGVHKKKSLKFLKRKCKGYNILDEDCIIVGAEEVVPRIINLDSVKDDIYRVIPCNESRDFETGHIDDYDYKLVNI